MPTNDDVRIGDFSRPIVPAPDKAVTTKESLEAAAAAIKVDVDKDEEALKPITSYEEKLKQVGLTRAKAAAIVDAILLNGHYAEEIKVTSTIAVKLRTRNARDIKRIQEILEAQRFTLDAHYSETWGRLLLAASLEAFAKDKFTHPNPRTTPVEDIEKAFMDRVNYVDGLPDPALRLLLQKLYKFDNRITAALEEGVIENF